MGLLKKSMKNKAEQVARLKSNADVSALIRNRLKEFSSFESRPSSAWFGELCFCIMTANASAKGGMKAQEGVGEEGFMKLSEKELSKKLKDIGYRFPNVRAKYIAEARRHALELKEIIGAMTSFEAREWLVENIKGIGMKEASHFLRNVGRTDLAILDKHIICSMGKEVKALTSERYLDIEKELNSLAKATGTNLAELDLLLWYGQTGEVLK